MATIKTDTELYAQIEAGIKINGNMEITPPIHKSIEDNITASKLSIKDGGNVVQALTGYISEITLTDRKNFAYKGYVDDSINTAISGIDFSPYFKHNGEVPMSGNINFNGNNAIGLRSISDQYLLAAFDINQRLLYDGYGNIAARFFQATQGFQITSNGFYAGLSTNSLTANRTIQFQDKDYTGVADISDIPSLSGYLTNSLASGNIFVGNGSNVATGVSLSLNSSGGSFGLSNSGVLTMPNADTSTRGLLTSSDWNIFNNKQSALSVQANGSIANNANVLSFSPKGFLKYPYYFDDFISGSAPNGNWVSSGAGLTITINNAPGKVGAFGIGTGSVSNGQRAYSLDSLKVVPNAFAFEVTYKIEIINLSTATEEYNCWFGFGDSKPAEGSNEIIFLYKRSASGNFWITKTVSGGVATTNVSSTAVTASVYYLKMEVNQAMTQVVFKIASGNNGTYSTIATHTTNIPTTGVYPIFSIMGEASSGGTNRLFHIDAFEFESSDGGRTIS